ncbi:DoxX family protein [Pseudonocardia abyssalis]|uniref:DoxX family membrane protein n=1 Tax=Pseudonocardia abyssalis TaxID=2792008 RepID=A0ABS6UKU8_9PSEU|nr:DoxX family protein [Pseudonocardia abyssalis]MBW0114907.1 DoxX family membrane protein [Pseudonocardia abyssalis]MBW0132891.1 DoxX family membrane protein [Pseudonocardia abyssalis]
MLAALFIQGGINALKAPQGHVEAARPVLDAVAPAVDKAVEVAPIDQRPDDELLIQIDAGVKIVAGSMLALGKFPRLASTALAASLIPTTLAGHRFWEETDEAKKAEQQIHFFKNVGLLGGLLIAAADTHGKPSVAYRGKRAARRAQAAVLDLTQTSGPGIGERVSSVAQDATGALGGVAAGIVGAAPGAGAAVSSFAQKAGTQLSAAGTEASARASEVGQDLSVRAARAAKKAEQRGAELQRVAEQRSAELQKAGEKRRAELLKRTAKQRKQLAKQAAKKRKELEKRGPVVLDQVTSQAASFGHELAARATAVGSEIAHQAEGAAKDARKRVHALTA